VTNSVIDMDTLPDQTHGAMEELLKTASTETGAAVAFVALYRADGSFHIITSSDGRPPWGQRAFASLARSLWLDPGLNDDGVLVSNSRVEQGRLRRRQANVATAILVDTAVSDAEWGIFSIVAHDRETFTDRHLDLISSLAKRVTSYLSAREQVISSLDEIVGKRSTSSPDGTNGPIVPADLGEPEESGPQGEATPTSMLDHQPGDTGNLPETVPQESTAVPADIAGNGDIGAARRAGSQTLGVLPGILAHLGGALNSIGTLGETVALIHLEIVRTDAASASPTKDECWVVEDCLKRHVRSDDVVTRVGEASFLALTRLRAGAVAPSVIEKRILKSVRKATGWAGSPAVQTLLVTVDRKTTDNPDEVPSGHFPT
jgi:hypothetical protein